MPKQVEVLTPGIVHIKSAVDAGGQLFLAGAAARASDDPAFGPAGGFWDHDGKLCQSASWKRGRIYRQIDGGFAVPDGERMLKVRKAPSWPRCWANSSLL